MTLPASGPFTQMMNGYFGNYDPSVQNIIWQSFLEKEGLSANPSSADTAKLQDFSQYVSSYYTNLLQPIANIGEKTKIVWTIFDILIELMGTATNTQIANQKVRLLLTQEQSQYQQEMSRTVIYQGTSTDTDGIETLASPNSDPALFTLGYGNLTMKDVMSNLIGLAEQSYRTSLENPSQPNNGVTFNLSRPAIIFGKYTLNAYFTFQVQQLGDGVYKMKLSVTADEVSGTGTVVPKTVVFQDNTLSNLSSQGAYDTLSTYFYSTYNAVKGSVIELSSYPNSMLKIDWLEGINFTYSGSDPAQQALSTKASQLRAEANKREQSFIDATKSRIDILKDRSDQQGRIVDAASNSKLQTSNILQSIISQLENIMDVLFKK